MKNIRLMLVCAVSGLVAGVIYFGAPRNARATCYDPAPDTLICDCDPGNGLFTKNCGSYENIFKGTPNDSANCGEISTATCFDGTGCSFRNKCSEDMLPWYDHGGGGGSSSGSGSGGSGSGSGH